MGRLLGVPEKYDSPVPYIATPYNHRKCWYALYKTSFRRLQTKTNWCLDINNLVVTGKPACWCWFTVRIKLNAADYFSRRVTTRRDKMPGT